MSSNCSEIPIKAYTPLAGGGITHLACRNFSQVDACGHRFQMLPGTEAMVRGALDNTTFPQNKFRIRMGESGPDGSGSTSD